MTTNSVDPIRSGAALTLVGHWRAAGMEVWEAHPSRRPFRYRDLPAGYSGEALDLRDPETAARIAEALADGWSLEP